MISSSRPDLPALLAYLKRVEEARKLVAEFDAWLASAPPLPDIESAGERVTAGRASIGRRPRTWPCASSRSSATTGARFAPATS